MFRLNLIGAAMLFGSALVGFALAALGLEQRWAITAALVLMIAADLVYRLTRRVPGRERWLGAQAGGFLALGPVWIMGLVLAVLFQFGLLD
jgi:hypothetical protein